MHKQEVTVYVSDHNENCDKVIKLLEDNGASYHLKNVTKNRSYMKELQGKGIYGTPATFFHIEKDMILGFQESRILQALKSMPE